MSDVPAPGNPDLEGLDLSALDGLRQALLGGRDDLNALSEAELERFIAINAKMRTTARVASKPPAGAKKKKASEPEGAVGDLLGF